MRGLIGHAEVTAMLQPGPGVTPAGTARQQVLQIIGLLRSPGNDHLDTDGGTRRQGLTTSAEELAASSAAWDATTAASVSRLANKATAQPVKCDPLTTVMRVSAL